MPPLSYARHQFPAVLIQHAVWLYLRFTLSYWDVEDLLAERSIDVSYETVRRWVRIRDGEALGPEVWACVREALAAFASDAKPAAAP